ncbi:adenylate/guanylate cyclase domain-containing protein [Devosia sp. 1635]|uniref:adenylate/guanylate cyclase domain-containing protein n=1 Tax=Devosia sp. 1635 TaxID=2726066 RepID=UPI0015636866|nr:adenylate/guanylate cyclase domain-containing protein [Devosia sp. 1635]
MNTATGLEMFAAKYAEDPLKLLEAIGTVKHLRRYNDGDVICHADEVAECLWIVDEGTVVIGEGSKITRRHKGDVVGEIAFHRPGEARRSTGIKADMTAKLWQIDRSKIDQMQPEHRVLWLEAVAAVLSDKLIEATEQRALLLKENVSLDQVLKRFVCEDGLMAVNGAFESQHIEPDMTTALLWFSDLAGFSTFSRELKPSDAAEQIRRFMEIQVEEIHGADGEIDKFMGDGLMAFWRIPDEHRTQDRVPRAVRAALASVERIKAIVLQEGLSLDIRIGLHLGPVVIGDFGGKDRIAYTLLGETVNSASRYEQARTCVEGMILGNVRLSEVVFSKLEDPDLRIQFEDKPRTFRDKSERLFLTHASKDLS